MNSGIRIDAAELRRAREARVLSRRELAERAGVAVQTVHYFESGGYERALPATIRKLAAALNVPPDTLVNVEREG